MAKRRHGDKNHDQFRDSGSDVRSTFVSKPRMLQNRPTQPLEGILTDRSPALDAPPSSSHLEMALLWFEHRRADAFRRCAARVC